MDLFTPAFRDHRLPDDPNVIELIDQVLKSKGYQDQFNWTAHPSIVEAQGYEPKLQQLLINRYWRLKLSGAKENTQLVRYCLNDEMDLKSYLDIFDKQVAPVIVRLGL